MKAGAGPHIFIKMARKYVPPKNRVADPLACLAPENFPEFGAGGGIRKSTLNFKNQMLNAEEERKKAEAERAKAPLTREQKEKDGWVVFTLPKVPRTVYVKYGYYKGPRFEIDEYRLRDGLPPIPDDLEVS